MNCASPSEERSGAGGACRGRWEGTDAASERFFLTHTIITAFVSLAEWKRVKRRTSVWTEAEPRGALHYSAATSLTRVSEAGGVIVSLQARRDTELLVCGAQTKPAPPLLQHQHRPPDSTASPPHHHHHQPGGGGVLGARHLPKAALTKAEKKVIRLLRQDKPHLCARRIT